MLEHIIEEAKNKYDQVKQQTMDTKEACLAAVGVFNYHLMTLDGSCLARAAIRREMNHYLQHTVSSHKDD